jgi:hypothetical protein
LAEHNVVSFVGLVAAIAFAAAAPATAQTRGSADTLEGRPIRHIGIVARNIYEPVPDGPLRPVYRIANALHIRTRPSTIRQALIMRPGDRWSSLRAGENKRALRDLDILEPVRLEPIACGDSVDVLLETQDDWSTLSEFAIQSAGGESFTSISLTERNLMGWGKSVSGVYREAPEGITRETAYLDPNLFGSRMRVAFHAGRGSEGASQGFDVGVPFYAESTPQSFGLRWNLSTTVARLFQSGEEAAEFDRRLEETEVFWGQGFPIHRDIVRLTGSLLIRERRFGPSRLDPGAPAAFGGGEDNVRERRWGMEARWWRPGYVERVGVDRLGGVEDVDLGPSFRVIAGYSPRWLGATADEGFFGLRFSGGLAAGSRSFGLTDLEFKTRVRREFRESIGRGKVRWVLQPRPTQTFVLAAYGAGAYRPERDFQEILGGLSGLRAQPVRALTGDQAWRFNAEHRWWIGHDVFQLVSLGTATFYDLGRTWGPASPAGGWRQDVGFGFRLSLPRSGQDRVARFDVAWPIDPRPGEDRGPVLSFGSGQAF